MVLGILVVLGVLLCGGAQRRQPRACPAAQPEDGSKCNAKKPGLVCPYPSIGVVCVCGRGATWVCGELGG